MWTLIGGIFMGWSLGANDGANLFGPAVASHTLSFRAAAWMASALVLLGAVTLGSRGFGTYDAIGSVTTITAFLTMVAAAGTVSLMTVLGLPVSTTQAVVGGLIGATLAAGDSPSYAPLIKVVVSWVLTPVGAALASFILYWLLTRKRLGLSARLLRFERVLRVGLVLGTLYSAFALGANNLANVTGVYVSTGRLSPLAASLLGAGAIALGILTFSKRVIRTVGYQLTRLEGISAFCVVLGEAITLNVFAALGVPISASQAIVGAVIGIGMVKGVRTINPRTLARVGVAWVLTPVVGGVLSWLLCLAVRPTVPPG
jgi:PiT family inorganic phosphate transporter